MKVLKARLRQILFCTPRSKSRYEFYLFEGNQIMVNRDVKKMQEDGWELAGEIGVKYSSHPIGIPRMLVPLKRKI